jgi:hypothetical protein
MLRLTEHARKGEKLIEYKVFVVKFKGKIPPGRPKHRLKDNFKIDVGEIVRAWTGFNSVAQDRFH